MRNCYSQSNQNLIAKAESENVDLVWDRYKAMQPQCGYGEQGICCRICIKGPCRIDPFGEGPQEGICGASADTIVARNLIRRIASGAASHSLHGKEIAMTLLEMAEKQAEGKETTYKINDLDKLKTIAEEQGIETENISNTELIRKVAMNALEDYTRIDNKPCNWLENRVTSNRLEKLSELGVAASNIETSVTDIMSRTHVGTDADPINLLLAGLKGSMADYTGMQISTNLSDALFGVPEPVISEANLGVINKDAVNIAVHGHNPLLSEIIVQVADEMNQQAVDAGARDGINIVGVCCTGNEVLLRRGVPLAANYLSQELAILTGALEAMVVDVQCIMPSVSKVSSCYHTNLYTTMPDAKIPGATHLELDSEKAFENAREIITDAINAFSKRDLNKVDIPAEKNKVIAGFSKEAVVELLTEISPDDPLKPLIDNIVEGNIKGIALFAGCNNVKVEQDRNYQEIAKKLLADNILVFATGCAAGAFAKNSLMNSQATEEYAGEKLKAVLRFLGEEAGLNAPLPPVFHLGSCVDNSRAVDLATALANQLDLDLDQLPVVASAPELMSEKAVAIGTWAAGLGLPVHVGVDLPVTGSKLVTETLTESLKDLVGGYFFIEKDFELAADKLINIIEDKRDKLGLDKVEEVI